MTRNTFGVGCFEIPEEGVENTNKSYWNTLGGKGAATHQPNSISLCEKTSKEFFKKASAFILSMVEMSNSESNKFDKIIRYKELLYLGIVTEEEIESKK